LSGGGPRARRGAHRGRGVRGCAGRRGGRASGPLRLRCRSGPGGPGRGAAPARGRRRGRRPGRPPGPIMIRHSAFAVEPWRSREAALDLAVLAQTESVFALANGLLGLRGNLDEGEPYGLPGTYLNSVYDLRPFAAAESAYGDPEVGQTVINVTNGKLIR